MRSLCPDPCFRCISGAYIRNDRRSRRHDGDTPAISTRQRANDLFRRCNTPGRTSRGGFRTSRPAAARPDRAGGEHHVTAFQRRCALYFSPSCPRAGADHTDAIVRRLMVTLFSDQRRVLTLNDAIQGIQAVFAERKRRGGDMALVLFDLLYLGGKSVLREPWRDRRKRLEDLAY
jgi:hypothetical protein